MPPRSGRGASSPRRGRRTGGGAGRRRLAGLLAAAAAVLALPAAASAFDGGTITHGQGAVSATLTWDAGEFGVTDARLSVQRAGVRYDVPIADLCGDGCMLFADDAHTKPGDSALKVADLDGDGEPEVLVDAYSGGAHCCTTARVLTWNGGGYTATDIDYGDVGYRLRDADGDGRPELVGFDPRFSSAFTYYAASGFPVQVLQVDHGHVADVTSRFPAVIAKDLRRQRADLRRVRRIGEIRGVLAAYVADLYSARRGAAARRVLAREVARHHVSAGYRRLLLRRLHAWGYR